MPKRKPGMPAVIYSPTYKNAAKQLKSVPPTDLYHILMGSGDVKMVGLAHALDGSRGSLGNKYTLTELCAMMSIKLPDVATMFAEHKLAQAKMAQMEHAPDILESNARAAVGRVIRCNTCDGKKRILEDCMLCDGKGRIENEECRSCKGAKQIDMGPCHTCQESGWVQAAGDANAMKMFAESAGLTASKGVAVNVNMNNFNAAGSFEDLMAKAEKANPRVLEVKAE